MQIAVTYTCAKNSWKGPVPQFASSKLPRTIDKLKKGERLMVTIYGDSISAGCGASQMIGIQPYMQPWDYLLEYTDELYANG